MENTAPSRSLLAAAWSSMRMRAWAQAAAIGCGFGLTYALNYATTLWDAFPDAKSGLLMVIGTRWMFLMLPVALGLAYGWAVLGQIHRRRPPRLRDYAIVLLLVVVAAALLVDPAGFALTRSVYDALHLSVRSFWSGLSPWEAHLRLWSSGVPAVLMVSTLWLLVAIYVRDARRSGAALSAEQLRLAEHEQRTLAEQLTTAQATVDPVLLFDTLTKLELCVDGDPARARAMLQALIRYLRAALPAAEDAVSTLGTQFSLVAVWLELAALRCDSAIGLRTRLPDALAGSPIAPFVLLPLVSAQYEAGDSAAAFELHAWREPGMVAIELRTATLPVARTEAVAVARQRLARLYGARASIASSETRPTGHCIRIELLEAA